MHKKKFCLINLNSSLYTFAIRVSKPLLNAVVTCHIFSLCCDVVKFCPYSKICGCSAVGQFKIQRFRHTLRGHVATSVNLFL